MQSRLEARNVRARRWWPVLTVVVALGITSCGGGGPGASISLQLDPATLNFVLGDSETVQVSVVRSAAATAALSLQADGAPAWVTVDFSPAVLSGSNLQSTMTVTTDSAHPDAQPTTFEIDVQAVGAGLNAQSTLSVAVELLDVTGTVVDSFGEPVGGVTVIATGETAVVTDGSGVFSFADMAVPYDLTVVNTVESVAHRFEGLTTGQPRVLPVSVLFTGIGGELDATITGTLSHASLVPLPADHGAIVCIEALNGLATGCDNLTTAGDSTYNLTASWSTPTDLNARVRAYIYELDANGVPTAIVASGTAGPTLLSDADAGVLDLTLADSSTQASMSVTTAAPNGYTLQSRGTASHYSDFASIGLNSGTPIGNTDTIIAPFFAGASLTAFATASSNASGSSSLSIAWSTGHASGDSTSLTLTVPPTGVAPPEGATNVSTATEFTVANPSGGVVTFVVQPTTPPGPTYAVTTAETKANIPDLAALGMGLPGGADYNWAAIATPHVLTADDAVTGDGYLGGYVNLTVATLGGGLVPAEDGQISTSAPLEFTTQ